MALSKEIVIDSIEVVEHCEINIRQATRILEDGIVISQTFHRRCISPGDPLDREDPKVVAIAQAIWKPEFLQKFYEKQARKYFPEGSTSEQ